MSLFKLDHRKLTGAALIGVVFTVVGIFCLATPPEFGGSEGHGGFVAPVGSGR